MKLDVHLARTAEPMRGFARFQFTGKMLRFQNRTARDTSVSIATNDDLQRLLPVMRTQMVLAPDESIQPLRARNPSVVRLIRSTPRQPGHGRKVREGIFAYLPLNHRGVERLVTGQLSGVEPDPDSICATGETPAALYIWLVFTPCFFARAIPALGDLFDEIAPEPCPIFTRAVNLHAQQLDASIGFKPACSLFPGCPDDLLVVMPIGAVRAPHDTRLQVRVARDLGDYAKVMAVRSSTYIAEQYCHYDEEFDGNDLASTHWLGLADGDAAGCIRARFFADFAKIERLAVRPDYRQSRLAFKLVRSAILHCRLKGYTRLYGHSREDLVPFWQLFGFRRKQGSSPFSFADLSYVEMVAEFSPVPEAITLASDPMVVLRPEGVWDEPGPFERPPAKAGTERSARIANQMRKLGRH